MIKVVKFGGSSMANSTQFAKVKDIVLQDPTRQIVVVSALGKSNPADIKVTDLLYTLAAHLKYHVPYEEIWNTLFTRFTDIKKQLGLSIDIESELNDLKSSLSSSTSTDYLVSRGEYFTARLISEYLGYHFMDSKRIIIFNYDGSINYEETEKKVQKAFEKHSKMVVPGFYGAYPNGSVRIMTRGGSDITGSILARCINASIYENWTDVSGFFAADPRIVSNPKNIKEVTYKELRELSYMGANVLHEETVYPIQELEIPINIKNTNDPSHPGTLIKKHCDSEEDIITGIAGKKNFVSFNVLLEYMANQVGFLRKVLSIFEKYNVSVEHMPSGIDSVSIICAKEAVEKFKYEIITDIKKEFNAEVTIDEDVALVAVVGRNMKSKIGLSTKIFKVLGDEKINIKMVDQSPLELNIIIGVATEDYAKAIKCVYEELMEC